QPGIQRPQLNTQCPQVNIQRRQPAPPARHQAQNQLTCPHCKMKLNKKNFKRHCTRKHSHQFETVSKDRFLACQCVDSKHGVFAVEKSFCGPATPIHVIKNTWGPIQKIMCEVDQCRLNADFARRSGMLPFECHHIQSLLYCPRIDCQTMTLTAEALETMVKNKWFGEERKTNLLRLQENADAEGVPLSVQLTVGGPQSKFHISVYEKKITYYSRLGRVTVSYDAKQNNWHCPCAKPRQSCMHKAVAKWHLFITKRELFRKVKSTEAEVPNPTQTTADQNASEAEEDGYPPDDKHIARMLDYLLTNKKLPADLPQALIEQSRDGKTKDTFPKHLVPKETKCTECENILSEQLITSKGKILTSTGVVEGISTYRKSCLNCGMVYRYQEWEDGIHNFDDHIFLSLHFCLMVRNALQVSKCNIIMCSLKALNNKRVLTVSEIPNPPDDYNGHVDINNFWDAVATEIISRGLIKCGQKNPFVVPPSYHHWAPWIGPHTRSSNSVLNTEFEKMQGPKMESDEKNDDDGDNEITVERLTDELVNLKVNFFSCYFTGGWAVITCPCGVVYSVKFNLRAESPRDFVDLLLSWKHFPNVSVYDYARGLALHANRRQPGIFDPFQGRLLAPTPENIEQASEGKVHVNMPWLRFPKMPADKEGHPLTGSSQHFALNDVFHQGNSKDQREVLRKLELVPELTGLINSQCVEQLFSGMRKNNYFLNLTTPSTHIFLQRNILHHYNMAKNQKQKKQYSKIVPPDVAMQCDSHGRVVLGIFMHAYLSQVLDENNSPTQHLAMVNTTVLTRFDFWSLGLERDIDGMILNCCLKVIEKVKLFAGDSFVISTWFPPLSMNHMDHLPDNAASLEWILLPVFVPGHWTLCILRPQNREIFYLDPLCGSGWRDESRTHLFRFLGHVGSSCLDSGSSVLNHSSFFLFVQWFCFCSKILHSLTHSCIKSATVDKFG
uniref:HMG domain-containing protein n=1 Tax=Nothobranchius furzeri TaxID=105023 RepID=A0A8C6KJQ0_NOTFU